MHRIIGKPACRHEIESPDNTLKYTGYAVKDALVTHFWQCKVCGELFEKGGFFAYTPGNCPRHMWEFIGWYFDDGDTRRDKPYRLEWIMQCQQCGKIHHEPWDVRSKGRLGGVPEGIDHPLVKPFLLPTPSVIKRIRKQEGIDG